MNNGFGILKYFFVNSYYGCDSSAVETTFSTYGYYSKNSASFLAFSDILLYLISNVYIISYIKKLNSAERTAPVQSLTPTILT